MNAAFVVSPRPDGLEMVVRGPWSADAADACRAQYVENLVLNHGLGFEEPDLEFLRDLPVRRLTVIARWLASLDPIHTLPLESLQLVTDPKLPIDLRRLPHLTRLSADWRQVRATVSHGTLLEDLYLGRYSEPNLLPLATSPQLTRLVMKDRPRLTSLQGLENFSSLTTLGIQLASFLTDFSALRTAQSLRELQLESCRHLTNLDDLINLHAVEYLNLGDCREIATAAPLRHLTNLRTLHLYGTTNFLDGDLTPLTALPHLTDLRLQNRRHYSPKATDIRHVRGEAGSQ
ncbi:hypothetical protein [Kribbella sp. NPDC051620]|uniref:hypothetical protein n=1 Tax=Kribbella sp. NPDC051620 TaxID=3364120 RepID=UPI0037875751